MTIHKEGRGSIFITGAILLLSFYLVRQEFMIINIIFSVIASAIFLLTVYFFRIPKRELIINNSAVLAPCDGKVVVVETVEPDEYFNERRIQVSIFMSALNVHVNLNPIQGQVVYSKYYEGKHFVAWHPKSSTSNERFSVVYRHWNGKEVLVKQIAGALARRIVNYLKVGQNAKQGDELGFIKFGSRVDLLLPLDTKINVQLGDLTKGGITKIAEW